MDVSFYLGELLMQQGEVKVPGLGIFSQVRMSAYYDENAALFYPPYNKVHFEPQADLNNTELAEYLVNRKGISLASAKYFIEKYIANLRQQAIIADVPLGNMGVFYTDRAELSFKPYDKLADDSELYGYAPVKINKANAIQVDPEPQPVSEFIYPRPKPRPEEPEITEEGNIEPVTEEYEEEPISSTYDEAFLDLPEEEEESRGPLRGILISLVIVAVIAVGIFALYRYQPATFNKLQFWKNNKPAAPVKATPKVVIVPKADSLHTDSAKTALKDSTLAGTDSVKTKRFELITGKGFKNLWGANEALKKYRAMGLTEAKLSEQRPGNLIKISIASFDSISESEAMKQKLIKEGKLTKRAYTIEIPKE
jgi:hypothetical protein